MNTFYKRQSGYVWDGEPKLCMTANGADWEISGGHPVMDAGLENWAMYSLFTKPGWWGNYAIKGPYKHGEDCEFDDVVEQPLSRSTLIDANNEARRGLQLMIEKGIASEIVADVIPREGGLGVDFTIEIHRPSADVSVILLQKYGLNWQRQIIDPASERLSDDYR